MTDTTPPSPPPAYESVAAALRDVSRDAIASYLVEVEQSRIEMQKRVGTPMWKRVGWEPRYWHGSKHRDPIEEAREFTRQKDVDGVVMVPLALLKALVERRECSARRDYRRDEDGPTEWTTHAICREAECHDGPHSNGYYTWTDADAVTASRTDRRPHPDVLSPTAHAEDRP